ncbi:hypothetical protein MBLNU459_g2637t1 [Dothideomycetes sp. NU459]
MDIFVRQIPVHSTTSQLKEFFRRPFADCGITAYDCQKFPNKPFATITVLDKARGLNFIARYGSSLVMNGKPVLCSPSKFPAPDLALQSLELQVRRMAQKSVGQKARKTSEGNAGIPATAGRAPNNFAIASFACGVWTHDNGRLTFIPHAAQHSSGQLVLGARQAVILLKPVGFSSLEEHRIDINYFTIDTVATGSHVAPTITFTLFCPPKFYRQPIDIVQQFASLGLSLDNNSMRLKKERVRGISKEHEAVAGTCFVYQVLLANYQDLPHASTSMTHNRGIPSPMSFPSHVQAPAMPLADAMTRLSFDLTTKYSNLSFGVKYQAMRLAQNGKLAPDKVRSLLTTIATLFLRFGEAATVEAIRRLYLYLVPAGPHSDADDYSSERLIELLKKHVQAYNTYKTHNAYDLANRHSHIVLIHKIQVTPVGVYLEGPEPEISNRVLRQYPQHIDYFLRVNFIDEDGESVRYDPKADQKSIYEERFKAFMNGTFIIAGRGFSFLGFSHSSLRSQTCWFMAPFVFEGKLTYAPMAFTDTTGTVTIEPSMLSRIPDVERNGRVFSDGVGKISTSLLKKVWRVYGTRRPLKPTVLQIRYAGAKGVVSLDSRLLEEMLVIRGSMEKFPGSPSMTVEICGAAFRPLPMVLNRQFIKIMEDLGVPLRSFMDLQSKAVQRLRDITASTINASIFLKESQTSKAAQLSQFLEFLSDIGLDYQNDVFLTDVVEMSTISKLREIKYRGRIPVKQGVTLYGIMDETGYLKEGEIHVVTEDPPNGGRSVLTGGRVIITRSPALHPGDIRVAKAVAVPTDSLLNNLSNCVIFSQHGVRDLPSQLSGGDLDGDLYNVIFDPTLMPRAAIADPANYPRPHIRELDRPVETKDMSDFFIKFMETDQLGQISTLHQQLADQKPDGVFDEACVKLAVMASTAVDFSKTGNPVDITQLPKCKRFRPDFMARSPRAIIEAGGIGVLDDDEDEVADDDPVVALDPDHTGPMRYYPSEKVLGHLYRAIDEQRFLADMHRQNRLLTDGTENTMMARLWDYVQRNNLLVQWEHHTDLARQIKEGYEHTLQQVLYEYAPSPHHPLTESELFAGTILGRAGGATNKRLQEMTNTMRARFDEILEFTVSRIVDGDDDDDAGDAGDRDDEALPRAIACLAAGMREDGLWDRKLGVLRSWRYVAAGVCLREMKRWRILGSGFVTLPRVQVRGD